jgi:hypothetical protein
LTTRESLILDLGHYLPEFPVLEITGSSFTLNVYLAELRITSDGINAGIVFDMSIDLRAILR